MAASKEENIPKEWPLSQIDSFPNATSLAPQKTHVCLGITAMNCLLKGVSRQKQLSVVLDSQLGTSRMLPYMDSQTMPSVVRDVNGDLSEVDNTVVAVAAAGTTAAAAVESSWVGHEKRILARGRRSACCVTCLDTSVAMHPSPGEGTMPQRRKRCG